MPSLKEFLDQYYAPQGGYSKYREMRSATPPSTLKQVARHFNDVDIQTVWRWNKKDKEELQNKKETSP